MNVPLNSFSTSSSHHSDEQGSALSQLDRVSGILETKSFGNFRSSKYNRNILQDNADAPLPPKTLGRRTTRANEAFMAASVKKALSELERVFVVFVIEYNIEDLLLMFFSSF